MLPKPKRLSKRSDFDSIFQSGRVFNSPDARVVWREGTGKVAVVAAKAIGSNAHRNLIRRRWREALRELPYELWLNLDWIVIVKERGKEKRGREILQALGEILKQIGK